MSVILPKSYHSLKTANEITKICEGLIRRYKFKMFIYARIFDDGSMYHLNNHLDYQDYFFSQEFAVSPPISSAILREKFSYFITPDQYELYGNSGELFGLGPPIFFFERGPNFSDMFMFCAETNNYEVFNLYINEMDVFEKFKIYFKEKALKLIATAKKNKIILPSHMQPIIIQNPSDAIDNKENLLASVHVQPYLTDVFGNKVTLTRREVEVLKLFAKGCTVKEVAKKLLISPRTAEFHWNNIKAKLSTKSRSEIIHRLQEMLNMDF